MKSRRRLSLTLLALLLASAATARAQDIHFDLNKRLDVMIFHPTQGGSGPIELWDERLTGNYETVSVVWKYTGFKWQEGGKAGTFTVVKTEGGSEVRLTVRTLSEKYVPPMGNVGGNSGVIELKVSGHGPLFDKVRGSMVQSRGMGWESNSDLRFHGYVVN